MRSNLPSEPPLAAMFLAVYVKFELDSLLVPRVKRMLLTGEGAVQHREPAVVIQFDSVITHRMGRTGRHI